MATKTVYVGDRDAPVWEAADRLARRNGTSVSRLVADALADYLPRVPIRPQPAPDDRWAAIAPDAA